MSKSLVVYFSYSGTTQHVAEKIAEFAGADLAEIKTVKTYSFEYLSVVEEAKHELQAKARPELQELDLNIADYDTVYIGYPNWCATCPMAIFTFMEKYDLSGKTIAPFCTHGGSGMGNSEADIIKACSDSKVVTGYAGGAMKDDAIKAWVDSVEKL